jgi:hypothetical protein
VSPAEGTRERIFSHGEAFLEAARRLYPEAAADRIDDVFRRPPAPLLPVIVPRLPLTHEQRHKMETNFTADGVAHFLLRGGAISDAEGTHPLIRLSSDLAQSMRIGYPAQSPTELLAQQSGDGTDKILDLAASASDPQWSKSKTSDDFEAHSDGLTQGGRICTIAMMLESPPLCGGYTYFQNIVRVSLALANDDREAFDALFLPDALTAVRSHGAEPVRIKAPVLYMNRFEQPQCFYRNASGEYKVTWRTGVPAIGRARRYLSRCTVPFGPSSTFVHLTRPGEGVFVQNQHVVHGRTRFIDRDGTNRVLARKWFVASPSELQPKRTLAMNIAPQYNVNVYHLG